MQNLKLDLPLQNPNPRRKSKGRRLTRRSSSLKTGSVDATITAELLTKLQKIDDERRAEEKREEAKNAMKEYFRKEERRMNEQVTSIRKTDLKNEVASMEKVPKKNSLYDVHLLMNYQEVMLTDSYTSPSARGNLGPCQD